MNKIEDNKEEDLINKYNIFLKQALKTFDILFLRYSKEEYEKIMQEKGKKMEKEEEKEKKEFRNVKKDNKKRKSVDVRKQEVLKGDEEEDDDKEEIDKEIFSKFMKEMKKKKIDFVNKK